MKDLFENIKNSETKVENNVLIINCNNIDYKTVRILNSRKGKNILLVDKNCVLKNTTIDFRSEKSVAYIKTNSCRANILIGYGSCVYIGAHTTFTATCSMMAAEEKDIYIGFHCMIAENVSISNTDGHPIYNYNGDRINHGADIWIGEHVWLGRGTDIMKGANINTGSIIGARSVVVKQTIPPFSTAVGVPAKVLKQEVLFERVTTVTKPAHELSLGTNKDDFKVLNKDDYLSIKDLKELFSLFKF